MTASIKCLDFEGKERLKMELVCFYFFKMEKTCSSSHAEREGSGEGVSGY